jgi:D-3-phosphoglycerate dehydrogenase
MLYIERNRAGDREIKMSDTVESLILDLLEFVVKGDRSYAEVMEAWRTSCPKLPVWEDANDRGLIVRELENGREVVRLTSAGRDLLRKRRSF